MSRIALSGMPEVLLSPIIDCTCAKLSSICARIDALGQSNVYLFIQAVHLVVEGSSLLHPHRKEHRHRAHLAGEISVGRCAFYMKHTLDVHIAEKSMSRHVDLIEQREKINKTAKRMGN